MNTIQAWQLLLVALAGWMNRVVSKNSTEPAEKALANGAGFDAAVLARV